MLVNARRRSGGVWYVGLTVVLMFLLVGDCRRERCALYHVGVCNDRRAVGYEPF